MACLKQFILRISGGFKGDSGGLPGPHFVTKLFQFHGEIYEKSSKMLKTNPISMELKPTSRNPGSAPVDTYQIAYVFQQVK